MILFFQYVFYALCLFSASLVLLRSGEIICHRFGLGHIWLGSVLIASATSFPELVTSIKAVSISSYDMSLSNIYGSLVFNLSLIGFAFYFCQQDSLKQLNIGYFLRANVLTILFVCLLILNYCFPLNTILWGLGWSSPLILLGYFVHTFATFVSEKKEDDFKAQTQKMPSFRRHLFFYSFAVIVIFFSGSGCVQSVKAIVKSMGLEENFGGFLFLAFATSLPEIVTVFESLRKKSLDLILSIIAGTNIFNIVIIVFTDLFLRGRALPETVSLTNVLTALLTIVQMTFVSFLLWLAIKKKYLSLKIFSAIVILSTILVVLFLFFFLRS